MRKERNYQFRERMLNIHQNNIRDYKLVVSEDELEIKNSVAIAVPINAGDVIKTAALDFIEYLFTSMGISAMLKMGTDNTSENEIVIALSAECKVDMGEAEGYKGFKIDIDNNIKIYGYDERGAAQALYHLEELMNIRKAPYIKKGTIKRKPMFSPQMVHSGYGLDEFPSEHLASIAHEGRDAILVFVKDVNITPYGYLDFNELIYRAAKYGIDVYAYSYLKSEKHPDDEGAEDYYERTYGRLFEKCPGLKGISLVGESVGFPSKDKNVVYTNTANDGIPLNKPLSGYWPCEDFPAWLNMIKKVIRRHKKDADIIFWTYNWGRQPEDIRIRLINSLPKDISLMATFEMFEKYKLGEVTEQIADYSLKFAGPGTYFESEAEAAKKNGIRLYSMTNTGGLTWDFGVIPYEPMPYQWMNRYEQMKKAHYQFGLCGIMESHHYGFFPSFISKLSKWVFNDPKRNMEDILLDILRGEFGHEHVEDISRALKLWSEAITYYTPTDNDMYGAFRIGPSFPFSLLTPMKPQTAPYALFGNRIVHSYYNFVYPHEVTFVKGTPISIKIETEIESLEKMKNLMDEGIGILEGLQHDNDNILRLINLGKFIAISTQTGINAKKWHQLICRLNAENSRDTYSEILDQMEELLRGEIENAQEAIPVTEFDSRLGWEPSMEYIADPEHINWKIRQVNYVINTEIKNLRNSLLS